ncbi:hypothetical protein KEM60_01687 [Austwickia sp. TVS 96-490-7B]|uniref:SDR family NAD(P)-dependent oxidoreductase n=1 Tax=Austwickia sp. TVS 96-490-7B TaxID=2830843 RepID=UPI001C58D41E|nr:SDR family NAD(P)-dependent oxidoreductase [Austwickia sp. TVS 96-490-7B]MBW3085487.1 hypothetical protein [Austwickia sp. TVS 96-490-7B]
MTTALITGATAGIGRAFAHELARTGHDLVLVARDQARLHHVATELSATYGIRCEVLPADLARHTDVDHVANRLNRGGDEAVDLLINNAGFGLTTSFLRSQIADEERQLAVLVHAVLVLSHAAGRAMTTRGRGQIINVSSVAAFTTMGTYSACKAWVSTFSQAMAIELRGTGVGVTALCPGYTHTEFHQRMGETMSGLPELMWLDADYLVRAALADARAGRVMSTPGRVYKAVEVVTGVMPRSVVRGISGLLVGGRRRMRRRGRERGRGRG